MEATERVMVGFSQANRSNNNTNDGPWFFVMVMVMVMVLVLILFNKKRIQTRAVVQLTNRLFILIKIRTTGNSSATGYSLHII